MCVFTPLEISVKSEAEQEEKSKIFNPSLTLHPASIHPQEKIHSNSWTGISGCVLWLVFSVRSRKFVCFGKYWNQSLLRHRSVSCVNTCFFHLKRGSQVNARVSFCFSQISNYFMLIDIRIENLAASESYYTVPSFLLRLAHSVKLSWRRQAINSYSKKRVLLSVSHENEMADERNGWRLSFTCSIRKRIQEEWIWTLFPQEKKKLYDMEEGMRGRIK